MADQVAGVLSHFLQRRRLAAVARRLGAGDRILDYGCGAGELARLVPAERYFGVDVDGESIVIARRRWPAHRFARLDEMPPPEELGRYDVVVALALVEHLPDPSGWLRDVRRRLAADGRILLTTPHPRGRRIHDLGARIGLFSREAADEHEAFLGRDDLARIAADAGFELVTYRVFLGGFNQLAMLRCASGPGGS